MNKLRNTSVRMVRSWPLSLPLVALLALGLTGLGASSASAAQRPVPFSYLVSGTVSPTSPTTFTLAGSGVSIPLGTIRYAGNVTIDSVNSVTGVITDTLHETLTAPDGSTVTIACNQVADPTKVSGVYLGTDNWTVTGGTGQFSGATGSGTGGTTVNLNTDTFAKAELGTIT